MNTSIENIIARSSNGTPVYSDPECHPHRLDIAAEAIEHMIIPSVPSDPTDRSQTKVVGEYDFRYRIGVNHLVEIEGYGNTYYAKRGSREYKSHMVLQRPADETKLTSVVIWYNEKWVLLTNYEGSALSIPEDGSEAYNLGTEEEQEQWDKFWWNHGLVPTKEEIKEHIKQKQSELLEEELWLHSWNGAMMSLEYNGRAAEIDRQKMFIEKMKKFAENM